MATPTDFDASDASGRLLWPGFPPTVFIRMERDSAEADANANVAFLRRNGVYSNVRPPAGDSLLWQCAGNQAGTPPRHPCFSCG